MAPEDPDASKRSRGRPRTLDLENVIDTALDAFWHGDPADISLNSICQMADVSKPSLYREVGNEDGLTSAVIDRYAERVLSDVFTLLQARKGLRKTLDALIDFACADPRMETGCLFYKMRAGKHRLGPQTRARIEELDAAVRAAYEEFLQACRDDGDWSGSSSIKGSAQYLNEQTVLAITQRASGMDPARIREMLTLAFSVFTSN